MLVRNGGCTLESGLSVRLQPATSAAPSRAQASAAAPRVARVASVMESPWICSGRAPRRGPILQPVAALHARDLPGLTGARDCPRRRFRRTTSLRWPQFPYLSLPGASHVHVRFLAPARARLHRRRVAVLASARTGAVLGRHPRPQAQPLRGGQRAARRVVVPHRGCQHRAASRRRRADGAARRPLPFRRRHRREPAHRRGALRRRRSCASTTARPTRRAASGSARSTTSACPRARCTA